MNKSSSLSLTFTSLKPFILKFMDKHSQSLRFLVVGAWNTFFGYFLFCILDTLFTPLFEVRVFAYMSASVLSTVFAILNAYISHKKITFRSSAKGIHIIWEFLRFSTTYAFTFAIGLVLLPLLVEVYGFNPKVAAAIITLGCTIVSYIGHSRFSFRAK